MNILVVSNPSLQSCRATVQQFLTAHSSVSSDECELDSVHGVRQLYGSRRTAISTDGNSAMNTDETHHSDEAELELIVRRV